MATLTPTYDTVRRITSEEKNARIPWYTWVSGTPKNKLFLMEIASGNDREVRITSDAKTSQFVRTSISFRAGLTFFFAWPRFLNIYYFIGSKGSDIKSCRRTFKTE